MLIDLGSEGALECCFGVYDVRFGNLQVNQWNPKISVGPKKEIAFFPEKKIRRQDPV